MSAFAGKFGRFRFLALGFAVLAVAAGQLPAQETADQLFLAPSAVPEAIYTPTVLAGTGSTVFTAGQVVGGTVINNVAVLPLLLPNPGNPGDGTYTAAQLGAINSGNYGAYFALRPTVDYSASAPGGASDTVTFNKPGVYYVQVQTNAGNGLVQVLVDTALADGAPKPTGPGVTIPAPPNDGTTIISAGDPDDPVHDSSGNITPGAMAKAQQQLTKAQTAQSDQDVINDIYKEYVALGNQKFEVNLVGHGFPGGIDIGTWALADPGNPYIDGRQWMKATDFQDAIDQYVSSIHFYSCSTAYGDAGSQFLEEMAGSIGVATGYTRPIWISSTGFYADAMNVPEPAAIVIWSILGGLAVGIGWRRRARGA
jgi:hypothetical protein